MIRKAEVSMELTETHLVLRIPIKTTKQMGAEVSPSPLLLSGRQQQVVEGVRRGLSNKEIANNLNLTVRTIKFHVSDILDRIGEGRTRLEIMKKFGGIALLLLFLLFPVKAQDKTSKQLSVQVGHVVTLNWGASPTTGVTGYNVYSSNFSGGPYQLVSAAQCCTYNDLALISGNTYYFVVTAVSPGGESVYSNEAVAVIPTP